MTKLPDWIALTGGDHITLSGGKHNTLTAGNGSILSADDKSTLSWRYWDGTYRRIHDRFYAYLLQDEYIAFQDPAEWIPPPSRGPPLRLHMAQGMDVGQLRYLGIFTIGMTPYGDRQNSNVYVYRAVEGYYFIKEIHIRRFVS